MTDVVHVCSGLAGRGDIASMKLAIRRHESGSWQLEYESLATAKTVADGEAEKIGESLGGFSLAIGFCPFCGAKLLSS